MLTTGHWNRDTEEIARLSELEATCMAQNTKLHFVKQITKGLNILIHGQFILLERSFGKFCHW